jgi:hypothetical protein
LCCLSKIIASLNAILILIVCMFQFNAFFDWCYCNSSIWDGGYQGHSTSSYYNWQISRTVVV